MLNLNTFQINGHSIRIFIVNENTLSIRNEFEEKKIIIKINFALTNALAMDFYDSFPIEF